MTDKAQHGHKISGSPPKPDICTLTRRNRDESLTSRNIICSKLPQDEAM
jgi:hypothetical protein